MLHSRHFDICRFEENYSVRPITFIIKPLFCNLDLFHCFAEKKLQNMPIFVYL